ncbi:MAG: 2-hydroxychromene-2-carboxylate isomerase [Zavarzinia sp.]|nr:2-hydroxychromene-2-carboxylate isomerase [Zavarzinia sp.]
MNGPIEFWFDFSSAYAFFAAMKIEALGARVGRQVLWRPFMLGTAFRETGARGLSSTPLKKDYARHDWARLARAGGLRFRLAEGHPLVALAATRAFYAIEEGSSENAARFARAVFERYYTEGLDTASPRAMGDFATTLGLDGECIAAACDSPAIKEKARAMSEAAVARGVFGSPWFFVDDEPFWGHDRMAMMEDWIRTGGW